jgi:CHAT domain-containing protein
MTYRLVRLLCLRVYLPMTLGVVFICFYPTIGATQVSDPQAAHELHTAWAERNAGKVASAISRLQRILEAPPPSLSLDDRWTLTDELLHICLTIFDSACLWAQLPRLTALVNETPESNAILRFYRLNETLLFSNTLTLWATDAPNMRDIVTKSLGKFEDPSQLRVYIDRQLLLARYHLFFEDQDAARLAVDRAFTVILSLDNIASPSFLVASWLSEIAELFAASGDSVRADGVLSVAGPFIRAALPATGPEYAKFRLAEAVLFGRSGAFQLAADAAKEARDAIIQLEIPPNVRHALLAQAAVQRILPCLVVNAQCAKDALAWHPFSGTRSALEGKETRDLSREQLTFILLDVLARVVNREPVPDALLKHLRTPLPMGMLHARDQRGLEATRKFALGLSLLLNAPDLARQAIVDASRSFLEDMDRALASAQDTVPLFHALDQIVVAFGAEAVAAQEYRGSDRVLLAVQMIDVLNRSLRHAEADAYVRLSMVRKEEERRLLHAASRLAARQTEAELKRLALLIQEAPSRVADKQSNPEFLIRRYLADHEITRREMRERVTAGQQSQAGGSGLPQLDEVRASLKEDEALVAVVGLLGHQLLHLCVRPHAAHVDVQRVDVDQVRNDVRILQAALTASHAPSINLDSQFPTGASVRLFGILFKPVEACLKGSRHLVWVPSASFLGLPIGALLEEVPQHNERGFDLAAGKWLGTRMGVSYFTSIRGFVAARRLAASRPAGMAFLGVGDPVLSTGQTQEGTARAVAIERRGAAAVEAVRQLEELKDTSRELKNIARLFGERSSRLLLRESASESRVRRQPIAQFRVLHFATHGLIKGDLPGLTEAALVLTPESETDSQRDGLLTASEIANLSLNAELVVLSACNTARYELGQFGVEVQGLATAFAISGVPSTVAALWPVESTRAESLMTKFFTAYLSKSRLGAAESLRLAMAAAVTSARGTAYAHPRFWAPFIVIGDGRSGRGAVASDTLSRRAILRNSSLFSPTRVGEAVAIVAIPQTSDYLVSGYADPVQGVFQRTLLRVTQDGRTEWASQDRATAFGKELTVSKDAIYVGASGMSQDIRFLPVVIKLGHDGTFKWRLVLSHGWQGSVIGLVLMSNGHLLTVSSVYQEDKTAGDKQRLILTELKPDGSELRRSELELPAGMGRAGGSMVVRGGRIFLALNRWAPSSSPPFVRGEKDLYDYSRMCLPIEESTIMVIDQGSFLVKRQATHKGTRIRKMIRTSTGRIIAVGASQASCAEKERAAVFEVRADAGLDLVFRDDGSYRSEAVWLSEGPRKSYVIVGQSHRVFDVEQRRPDFSIPDFSPSTFAKFDLFALADGMILWLDAQGGVIARSWLAGGTSTSFDSGLLVGDRLITVGVMGLEWFWADYELGIGK